MQHSYLGPLRRPTKSMAAWGPARGEKLDLFASTVFTFTFTAPGKNGVPFIAASLSAGVDGRVKNHPSAASAPGDFGGEQNGGHGLNAGN